MIEEAEELFAEGQLAEGVAVLRDCIATQSGCSEAHFLLAELYETGELEAGEDAQGEGQAASLPLAIAHWRAAAELGNAKAMAALGMHYATSMANPALPVLYYAFAANASDTWAQMALGFRYLHGHGVRKSCERAQFYYAQVADKAVDAVQEPGVMPVMEKIRLADDDQFAKTQKQEDEDFVQFYEYSAAKGDASAQAALGQLALHGGRGVAQDEAVARQYFEQAATQGHALAQAQLGMMYEQGLGVEANNATAIEYYTKAAASGQSAALNGLGYMHLYGNGVERNFEKAYQYFLRAADAGSAEAQHNLGSLFVGGMGVAKDLSKGLHYFMLGAQQGHTLSLYNLATMYANGMGTPKSCPTAVKYFKAVAERGPWTKLLEQAYELYVSGDHEGALLLYSKAGEMGYELGQSNAAYLLDVKQVGGALSAHTRDLAVASGHVAADADEDAVGAAADELADALAVRWYIRASEQGNVEAKVKLADAYYYGVGRTTDREAAATLYAEAADAHNAEAMFSIGYMHQFENGDLHLAKRYYDQAAETAEEAALPVSLMLLAIRAQLFALECDAAGIPLDLGALAFFASLLLLLLYIRAARLRVPPAQEQQEQQE